MNAFQWTAVIVGGSTVYIYVAYMALCTAVKMQAAAKANGFDLPKELKLVCWALYIGGVPADVIYNWTIGNLRFRFQTPWKWTYSSRIQWHIDNEMRSKNPRAAWKWAVMLNAGDPSPHIKRVELTREARMQF